MDIHKSQQRKNQVRQNRVKNSIAHSNRLRLSVYKSEKYLYAQIIDDTKGTTICQSSNIHNLKMTPDEIGADLSKKAKDKKVTEVVFDRGKRAYHGSIKQLAEAARKGGLTF